MTLQVENKLEIWERKKERTKHEAMNIYSKTKITQNDGYEQRVVKQCSLREERLSEGEETCLQNVKTGFQEMNIHNWRKKSKDLKNLRGKTKEIRIDI